MVDTYAEYIENLRVSLRAGCGKKTEFILAEARAHLEEGIEELLNRGLSRQAAEETLMTRFGDADAVCKWYCEQHSRPTVWRAARWPLVTMGFTVLFWAYQNVVLPEYLTIHFGGLIVMDSLLVITTVLCYHGKRMVSGVVALAAAGIFGVLLACFCLWSVPVHWEHGDNVVAKWSVQSLIREAQTRTAKDKKELAMLVAGRLAFQSPHEPKSGVGDFHDGRGYLSSIYVETLDPRVHVYFGRRQVNGIFATYEEARHFWIAEPSRLSSGTGKMEPAYLANVLDELAQDREIIRAAPTAGLLPVGVKLKVFANSALYPAMFLLVFGVVADLLGAAIRMLVLFARRKRRPGPLTS